jgi:hypothetical protein
MQPARTAGVALVAQFYLAVPPQFLAPRAPRFVAMLLSPKPCWPMAYLLLLLAGLARAGSDDKSQASSDFGIRRRRPGSGSPQARRPGRRRPDPAGRGRGRASTDEARRRVLAAGTPLDMERVRAQSLYPQKPRVWVDHIAPRLDARLTRAGPADPFDTWEDL